MSTSDEQVKAKRKGDRTQQSVTYTVPLRAVLEAFLPPEERPPEARWSVFDDDTGDGSGQVHLIREMTVERDADGQELINKPRERCITLREAEEMFARRFEERVDG